MLYTTQINKPLPETIMGLNDHISSAECNLQDKHYSSWSL